MAHFPSLIPLKQWLGRHPKLLKHVRSLMLGVRHLQWRYWRAGEQKNVLVYCGAHRGSNCTHLTHRYKKSYLFEADPELASSLASLYCLCPSVQVLNYALSDHDGTIDFHISNNTGGSSSLGQFNEDFIRHRQDAAAPLEMLRTIRVPCLNLINFVQRENINDIDSYISDIQGMDLTVLRTLQPLIESHRIGSICCEVAKDEYRNPYDLPDNSLSAFKQLLDSNYRFERSGVFKDGKWQCREVPDGWWEMDCLWVLR